MDLTYKVAKAHFAYDPTTGFITWMAKRSNRALAGSRAGSLAGNGYRQVRYGGRRYLEHRVAWLLVTGAWPTTQIDHIDRDRANNRWANLRSATPSQNMGNTKLSKSNKSGARGVLFRDGKWMAVARANKKQIYLGRFASKSEAVAAYRAHAQRHFGEEFYRDN